MVNDLLPIVMPYPTRGRGWDFVTHRKYHYLGGEDFELGAGSTVHAVTEGTAIPTSSTVTIHMADGRRVTTRHIHPNFATPHRVRIGDPIGTSGADGGLWPHWEVTGVDGVRRPLSGEVARHLLAKQKAAAQTSKQSGYNYVKRIATYLNGRHLGQTTAADRTGRRGPIYWALIQKAGRVDRLYPRPYLINGVPGPRTYALERHYATKAK